MTGLRLFVLAVALAAGCASDAKGPYDPAPPPGGPVPAALAPEAWRAHLVDDLLPYWRMAEARGTPVGNYPTFRGMDGSVQGSSLRKPRMIGRQVFTYAVGFLVTGDEELLELAREGTRWLLDHARDPRGGWHADLDASGAPAGDAAKTAQDAAYAAMGPAAWYFVTRDAEAEAAVLATRDLLFDPARYWDAANGRIRDGLDATLTTEHFVSGAGSWELVAQLDPLTAVLLLVQPVLSEPARREQVLGDLRTLALRLRDSFWRDGLFWGSTGTIGRYGSRHTDFGHILKAYWALRLVDGRLPDHPLHELLATHAPATLERAHDAPMGRWAKAPTSATTVSYGADWWAYAEADQLAATLALHDPAWIDVVAGTAAHFVSDFVDRARPVRELVPSINRSGVWVAYWPDGSTAKANEWKNGFHGAEHALLLFLVGHWLGGTPAPLYFALPADRVEELAAASTPYTLRGRVVHVEDLRPVAADPSRRVVRVSFGELH